MTLRASFLLKWRETMVSTAWNTSASILMGRMD